jgi:cytochrome c peroxidase
VIGSLSGGVDLTNVRSPSLRDSVGPLGSNGPFMHNGVFANLSQVIAHYNTIPNNPANTNLDNRLSRPGGQTQNLGLNQQQSSDLVAFLGTLTGSSVYTDVKWSNPFNASNELSVIILPSAVTTTINRQTNSYTMTCRAAPGLSYGVETSTNLKDWTTVTSVAADALGNVSYSADVVSPKAFYRFTYTP